MTSTADGLVSVIIPVHRRPRQLVDAVESVLSQSYARTEVIVVDDASGDDTPAVAEGLASAHPAKIRWIPHDRNLGPGASRETGRRAARGEFVQYLDSDDVLLPRKLELQVAKLRREPDADVATGWTRKRDVNGTLSSTPVRRTGEALRSLFPALLGGRIWITATPLYRSSSTEAAGPWPDLRRDEDWVYEARLASRGVKLSHVDEWVAEHRAHGGTHAGTMDWNDHGALRQRAGAHLEILACARAAGVSVDAPEMARFARALFHLARRCGRVGLADEAASLLRASRESSTMEKARRLDFRIFGLLVRVAGWRAAARLVGVLGR